MPDLILVPLADKPALAAAPLRWSLELWGDSSPWFSAADWHTFYMRGAKADFSAWALDGVDQEQIYLASVAGEVVGAIALVDFDDLEEFAHLKPWVAAFVVDPKRRGTGIGSQMLAAIEAKAREFAIPRLHLWTTDQRDFYLKRGYEMLRHRDYSELNPPMSIDVLQKIL